MSLPKVLKEDRTVVSAALDPVEAVAFRRLANSVGKSRNYLLRQYVRYISGISADLPVGVEGGEA